MQAITVRERDAGVAGLSLTEMPYPHAAENDAIVHVHAAGFTPGELDWPGTWTDRAGRDRAPSVPGHDLSGVVVQLGYGTTGLTVGQRVFGLCDWTRNGSPPRDGRAIFFVVEPDRARLADLAQRVRDGRLKPRVGAVRPLAEAPAAFAPGRRTRGKTIIQVAENSAAS
jgi:NADPH:quinone reductase-like Zn-dependent oxidoreductase